MLWRTTALIWRVMIDGSSAAAAGGAMPVPSWITAPFRDTFARSAALSVPVEPTVVQYFVSSAMGSLTFPSGCAQAPPSDWSEAVLASLIQLQGDRLAGNELHPGAGEHHVPAAEPVPGR